MEIVQIENRILNLRSQQVMIDRDLAELYGVETKRLNEQVKRNIERFPERFRFQLSEIETAELVANCDRFNSLKHSSSLPYAFTEQGVAMLATVLKSPTAVEMSIHIMDAFIAMRRFILNNAVIFKEIENLKQHQFITDKRIDEIFDKMSSRELRPTQGVFFQGQIFDAYALFENIIGEAKNDIILIDNYVDLSVLERFSKKKENVKITIFTNPKTAISPLDVEKFNAQYGGLELKFTEKVHDRFLIIDENEIYHLGASLKDLGKKCFAFSKLESRIAKKILDEF